MNNTTYNGWTNYETWVTALWIDNNQSSYNYRCELTDQVRNHHCEKDKQIDFLSESLKDWISNFNPLEGQANLFTDLLESIGMKSLKTS